MQKLLVEFKNTPGDTQLVPCSVNLELNKDENLSVSDGLKDDKLVNNNLEVDQSQLIEKQVLRVPVKVYVLNQRGNPLMPCSPKKAKQLLKKVKAKVIKRSPFTIQMLIPTGEAKQEITLGIDTGFGFIGFSAISENSELFSGTLKLDGKTKERLDERRMYRRNRRNRLWYREPRFNNRTKKKGWLPPSIERRYQTHLTLIERIKKLLPISKVIIEVAKFDIQKIENPNIEGKGYRQGNMYDYQNLRSYLMSREKGVCEHCKKDFKNNPSHIHHRKPKANGGTNKVNNLMLLHKKCHKLIHKKIELLKKYEKASVKQYKPSTFMSIINTKFYTDVEKLEVTYGNITFVDRNNLGLEKSHSTDAFVIAKGNQQKQIKTFKIIQKHRNNRVLQLNRKKFKPSIKKNRSIIQPLDLFWVKGKCYSCKGMFNKGSYILFGDVKKKKYFNMKVVEKYFNQGSFVWS